MPPDTPVPTTRESAAPDRCINPACGGWPSCPVQPRPAEVIARRFHEEYEHLAPAYGYETRKESAVPWEDVPEQNKALMIHVVGNLLAYNVIDVGMEAS